MKEMPTQIYILEEHNEAFLVWNWGVSRGLIKKKGNMLVHVDEHIDMSPPRLKSAVPERFGSLKELARLTYEQLAINTYIVPAIFQGIIDRVLWVKERHYNFNKTKQTRWVRTFNNEGKMFILFNPLSIPRHVNVKARKYQLKATTIEDIRIPSGEKPLLDISLNAFSCINNPGEYAVNCIEITKNEFEEFNSNVKYHPLRYELLGHRIETEERGGKFYYLLNDHEEVYEFRHQHVSNEEAIRRIDLLGEQLKKSNVVPGVITIARSIRSGFTPADQAEMLEEELMRRLQNIYDAEVHYIEDFFPERSRKEKNEIVFDALVGAGEEQFSEAK